MPIHTTITDAGSVQSADPAACAACSDYMDGQADEEICLSAKRIPDMEDENDFLS